MATATPYPETQAGRKKLAAKGKALPDKSFPIPNVSYLKKAIRAVGRAKAGKRPALARLIRKRGRELGAWNVVKGSWADNTRGAVAAANALREALELTSTVPVVGANDGPRVTKTEAAVYKRLKARKVPEPRARLLARNAARLAERKRRPKVSAT